MVRIALCIFTILALLGGCDADSATFALDGGEVDHAFDQVVDIQVFPVRREYALEGDPIAKTENHLRVFAIYYNGNIRAIPLNSTHMILEEGEIIELTENESYPFIIPGEKMVTVDYGPRNARYTIMVRSGEAPGTGSDDGTSIIFEPKW
jgi:hypothetical protein